jgi:hypothetical protein
MRKYFECPCCGKKTLTERGNYEICKVCGWEDDDIQSDDPDYAGGANHISLNEAQKAWAEGKDIHSLMIEAFHKASNTSKGSPDEYWQRVVAKHAPKPPNEFFTNIPDEGKSE